MKAFVFLCFSIFVLVACEHQPPKKGLANNGSNSIDSTRNCSPDTVYFVNDVLPIILANCAQAGCHDAVTQAEGVILDKYSNILNTGEVVKGQALQSKLYEVIAKSKMPPYPMSLSQAQKDLIAKWINQGAKNNFCASACDTSAFTYAANIKPIIDQQCNSCHNGGTILLNDHAHLSSHALDGSLMGAINHVVGYKPMPGANIMISECDRLKIQKWVDAGALNN